MGDFGWLHTIDGIATISMRNLVYPTLTNYEQRPNECATKRKPPSNFKYGEQNK